MIWQHTPYNPPLALATALSVLVSAYIWQRRGRPGAWWLFCVMCGVVIWGGCYTLQVGTASVALKKLFNVLEYVGIVIVPTGWLAFALEYTGRGAWFRRRWPLFVVMPVLTLAVLFTNSLHGLFWDQFRLVDLGTYVVLQTTPASGFWVHALYSYALLLAGNVILLYGLLDSPHSYRLQFVLTLVGCLLPWAANALTIFDVTPYDHLDLTPFAFALTGLILALGLFRYRLLDVLPMALDLAVERMRDILLVLDERARIVNMNPAAQGLLRTIQEPDALGLTVTDVLPELAALLSHPSRGDVEAVIALSIYGEPRHYEGQRISMQPRGAGCLIILHDITARQRTEDRLRQLKEQADEANQAKSRFLALMNHELRNPLTGLMGHTELLQMQLDGDLTEGQRRSVAAIVSSSEQLLEMINESLDISRIESGRVTLYPEDFRIDDLVSELADQVRPVIERKGNRFRLQVEEGLGQIHADRVKTRQCVLNLLTNAAKFTENGEVSLDVVRIGTDGDAAVVFTVRDTGIGIPTDRHEAIFEPFSQATDETASRHGGTGLGLSIARNFARLMGGDIQLESRPGAGSRFALRLPVRGGGATQSVSKPSKETQR